MALYSKDPDNVWAYFDTVSSNEPVVLPTEMSDDICEFCRHLIPDNPAGCCWECTFDLDDDQVAPYLQLRAEYEARIIAVLATM